MEENKESVTEGVASGKYTVSNQRKGRSFVWKILGDILKSDGTVLPGFLCCRSCNTVVRYDIGQISNLKRHICCRMLKFQISDEAKDHSSLLKSPTRSEDSEPIVINAAKKPKYSTPSASDIPSPKPQSRPETHTPRLDTPSRQETYISAEPRTSRQDPLHHVEKTVVNNSGNRDECDVFAEGWAIMYRKLTVEQRIYAKRLIDDTLMHAQLGQLAISSSINLDPISSNRFGGKRQVKVQAYSNDKDNFSDT
ncbi:uncharacterized protein [Musca autumnalis]|uniref:uncharacterized protein n=1 Tax=Musca autumnalis TaxID=221902 RepID=UPI003CF37217